MSEKKKQPMPFLVILGAASIALGLAASFNGGNGALFMLAGVGLLIVGFIQRSSQQRKAQHEELMAEMRRQREE